MGHELGTASHPLAALAYSPGTRASHDHVGATHGTVDIPDPRMTALAHPDTATASLRAAWSDARPHGPLAWDTPPTVVAVEALRAHPGSRWTLRYRLQPVGDAPPMSCIAKAHTRDRADIAAVLYHLSAARQASAGAWSVPRPLAYLPTLHVLLVEDVPGQALRRAARHSPVLAAAHAARWLGRFHATNVLPPDAYDLRDPVATARRWSVRLVAAQPDLRPVSAALLDRLVRTAPRWPPPPAGLRILHGDLSLDHLILGPGTCAAIDWDDWRVGDPAEDAGRLLASLRHAATRHPEWLASADRAAVTFRRVYLEREPAATARLAFYEALACLRVACRTARRGDDVGRARAASMLAAGARALDLSAPSPPAPSQPARVRNHPQPV